MTETDVDTSIDVDLTKTVPCEADDDNPCKTPATWLATYLCPTQRHTWPYCDWHKADSIAYLAAPGLNICAICPNSPLPKPYVEWRPL